MQQRFTTEKKNYVSPERGHELSIVPYKDNLPDQIIRVGPFCFSKNKMAIDPSWGEPDFDTWMTATQQMEKLSSCSTKWLAMLIVWGQGRFGEKYTQAMEVSSKGYSTLANAVHTVTTIEEDEWNDDLNFEHFQALSHVQGKEERVAWRDKAIQNDWSVQELKNELKRASGKPVPWSGQGTFYCKSVDDKTLIVFEPFPGGEEFPFGFGSLSWRPS